LIRASYLTIPTANALVVIHHHDAVGPIVGCSYHANIYARGVLTVHTWASYEDLVFSNFSGREYLIPGNAWGNIIVSSTR
jgi:hypothetical protein